MAGSINHTLQELLDNISHRNDNTSLLNDAAFQPDVTGDRLTRRQTKANGFVYNDDTGLMTGRKTGTHVDVGQRLEALQEYKKSLEEAGGTGVYKKMVVDEQKAIGKLAKRVYEDAAKGDKYHAEVIAATHEQQGKILKQIAKKVEEEDKALKAAVRAMPGTSAAEIAARDAFLKEGREKLIANHKSAIEAVTEHFGDIREAHEEYRKDLKTIAAEIEKETSISAAEHMKTSGSLTALEKGSLNGAEHAAGAAAEKARVFARTAENLKMGSARSILGVVLTGGLWLDAARRVVNLITAKKEPDGSEPSVAGEVPIIAAETGGGLLSLFTLAGHARH